MPARKNTDSERRSNRKTRPPAKARSHPKESRGPKAESRSKSAKRDPQTKRTFDPTQADPPPVRKHGPKSQQAGNRQKSQQSRGPRQAPDGPFYLYGIHAVEAVLNNPARAILKLKLTPNACQRLERALRHRAADFEQVSPKDLDHLLGADCVHQGAALQTHLLPEPELADLAVNAQRGRPLLILDQITDPHNLGAIMRSCAVFGAAGIVTTRRHSPPLTGVVAKTASGGLEHVPVVLVPNLARAMVQLKDMSYQIIGLAGDADGLLQDADFDGPIALVLGAEGAGLRRLTRDHCDQVCAITAPGPLASLNVSNAAAVCLHLAAMRRAPK